MLFITKMRADGRFMTLLVILYYLLIVAGLLVLYGKGNFSTSPFVYQGF
jgi:hypothetical protein